MTAPTLSRLLENPTVYRLKVVPDDRPNDDGSWVTVTLPNPLPEVARHRWRTAHDAFQYLVPHGCHMVKYEEVR